MNESRLEELMVKVVDGVATPAEREELMAHVAQHPELRRELEEQQALQGATEGWMKRLEADLLADSHTSSASGFEVILGTLLLLVPAVLLSGWAVFELFRDPEVPGGIALLVAAMAAGCLVLGWHVVRTRFLGGHKDPYDEVIR